MGDMASRTNTIGLCCTRKASDPTAGCPAAPDCAGGLDYRTQYLHTTLCTLRHRRSCSSRCVRSMTSRAPPASRSFDDLGNHLHSVRAGVAGARGGFSGDPAPKRGPRQRPGMGSYRVRTLGGANRNRVRKFLCYYPKQNTTTTATTTTTTTATTTQYR